MDILEKVNISYEEAKNILDEANGDLLEAMALLECQGKIRKPEMELMRSDAGYTSDNTASEETVEKKDTSDHTTDEKAAATDGTNTGAKNSECTRQKVKRAMRKLIEVPFMGLSSSGMVTSVRETTLVYLLITLIFRPLTGIMILDDYVEG